MALTLALLTGLGTGRNFLFSIFELRVFLL